MKKKIDKFFQVTKKGSSIKTEIIAGLTTFLAMSYILIVNPNNLLANGTSDPRFTSVFIATALGSAIGTLFMGIIAKMPFAQAPGMGLNALVGAIIGGSTGFAYSYSNSMALIFISGLIFFLISIIPYGKDSKGKTITLRKKVFEGVPKVIRESISVGIGLYIAFIGLQNAHIIVNNDFTLLQLINLNDPTLWTQGGPACGALVCFVGLIVIAILSHYKVKGSVIYGIIASTILSFFLGIADISILAGTHDGITWNFIESLKNYFTSDNTVFMTLLDGFSFPKNSLLTSIMLVISFCMIDMFDTIGTIIGCCESSNMLDSDGKPQNYGKIMYSESMATMAGALIGTSTVTTFLESSTGIAQGGRTGLTSVSTAILFILSIFLLPIFAFIPVEAASCALIYVGALMIKNVSKIDLKDIRTLIPAFITIITIPLSYSITDGIGFGIITYVIINVIIFYINYFKYKIQKRKNKLLHFEHKPLSDITPVTIIILILFLIYFLVPII